MLKTISNLGKALNAAEQKMIQGGYVVYDDDDITIEIDGNWGRPGEGVVCYCDGVPIDCSMANGC